MKNNKYLLIKWTKKKLKENRKIIEVVARLQNLVRLSPASVCLRVKKLEPEAPLSLTADMEDIEDLFIGAGGDGVPPGFRLPITSVGLNPKKNKKKPNLNLNANTNTNNLSQIEHPLAPFSPKVPGTEVPLSLSSFLSSSLSIKMIALAYNFVFECFW